MINIIMYVLLVPVVIMGLIINPLVGLVVVIALWSLND
jgi:hypothetical protein